MLETAWRPVGARVAKWQTQRTQNPPVATPWEFDPPPGHHARSLKSPGFRQFNPLTRLSSLRYSAIYLSIE